MMKQTELPGFSVAENWQQLAEYWSMEVNRLEAKKALEEYQRRDT